MSRRLVANVTMMSDDGMVAHFPVGMSDSDVPTWAASRMTNPDIWDLPDVEVLAERLEVPPKSGAGSSAWAWVVYAKSAGLEVKPDAKRDDVIAACEAAGVPTD